jgi:hypothetical protein
LPAPPKPEPTQREEESEAFLHFANTTPTYTAEDVWHAALAYRDAQNRADLDGAHALMKDLPFGNAWQALHRLRKRCGL